METQVNSQSTCHLHSLICIALDQCSKFDFASQWLKRSSEILPIKAMLARAAWRRPDGADTSDLFNLYGFLYIIIICKHVHCPFCAHLVIVWHMVLICFSEPQCVSISEVQTMFSIDFWYLHTYNISILFLFLFLFYSISNSISISILFYF